MLNDIIMGIATALRERVANEARTLQGLAQEAESLPVARATPGRIGLIRHPSYQKPKTKRPAHMPTETSERALVRRSGERTGGSRIKWMAVVEEMERFLLRWPGLELRLEYQDAGGIMPRGSQGALCRGTFGSTFLVRAVVPGQESRLNTVVASHNYKPFADLLSQVLRPGLAPFAREDVRALRDWLYDRSMVELQFLYRAQRAHESNTVIREIRDEPRMSLVAGEMLPNRAQLMGTSMAVGNTQPATGSSLMLRPSSDTANPVRPEGAFVARVVGPGGARVLSEHTHTQLYDLLRDVFRSESADKYKW